MPTAANSPQKLQTHSFKTAVAPYLTVQLIPPQLPANILKMTTATTIQLSFKWLHETLQRLQFTAKELQQMSKLQ